MTFGKEFTTAVEQKQIAQQDAERAKFVVEKAEQERQAAVIRAEGEAEAASTISKALDRAGEGFVTIRRIEASKAIGGSHFFLFLKEQQRLTRVSFSLTAQSLAGSKNVTYLPASGSNMLMQVPTP